MNSISIFNSFLRINLKNHNTIVSRKLSFKNGLNLHFQNILKSFGMANFIYRILQPYGSI